MNRLLGFAMVVMALLGMMKVTDARAVVVTPTTTAHASECHYYVDVLTTTTYVLFKSDLIDGFASSYRVTVKLWFMDKLYEFQPEDFPELQQKQTEINLYKFGEESENFYYDEGFCVIRLKGKNLGVPKMQLTTYVNWLGNSITNRDEIYETTWMYYSPPTDVITFESNGMNFTMQRGQSECMFTYKDTNYASYSGEVVIPSQVEYNDKTYAVTGITDWAFLNCMGLTKVTIPKSVKTIGENNPFTYCFNLEDIVVEQGGMFFMENNCLCSTDGRLVTGLAKSSYVCVPNSVTTIGDGAFYGFDRLNTIELHSDLKKIGFCSFDGCRNLQCVSVPDGVEIDKGAFQNCSRLELIFLPNDLQELPSSVFSGCKNLREIVIINPVPPLCVDDTFEDVPDECCVKVPEEAVEAYKAAEYWSRFVVAPYTAGIKNLVGDGLKIKAAGEDIIVSGTEKGDIVKIYSADGRLINSVIAENRETVIHNPMHRGMMYIVKCNTHCEKLTGKREF